MTCPNKFRIVFKTIACLVAAIFLWNQIAWAGDFYSASDDFNEQQSQQFAPDYLNNQQEAHDDLINLNQSIEDAIALQGLKDNEVTRSAEEIDPDLKGANSIVMSGSEEIIAGASNEEPPNSLPPTQESPIFSITTEEGDVIYYQENKIVKIKKQDGTVFENIIFDNTGYFNGVATGDTNIMHIDGILQGALEFNGIDDYIQIAQNDALSIYGNTQWAVSVWIYAHSDGVYDNYGRIIDNMAHTISAQSTGGYRLRVREEVDGSMKLEATVVHDISNAYAVTQDRVIQANTWHHCVMVYNEDSDKRIKLYVDGDFQTLGIGSTLNSPGEGDVSDDTNHDLFIGKTNYNEGAKFDGAIDDVRIYNQALTGTEILELYNNGDGTEDYYVLHESGMVPQAQWTMNDNAADTTVASTGSRLLQADITYPDGTKQEVRDGKTEEITKPDGIIYTYNDEGLIASVAYPDNTIATYLYNIQDETGAFFKTALSDSEKISYYDDENKIAKVKFNSGKIIEYADGMLSRVIDEDGTIYTYDIIGTDIDDVIEYGVTLKEIDKDGIRYYIGNNKIVTVELQDGTLVKDFELDDNGNLLNGRVEFSDGTEIRIENRKITYVNSPDGTKTHYSYALDSNEEVLACDVVIDDHGNLSRYTYTKDPATGRITISEEKIEAIAVNLFDGIGDADWFEDSDGSIYTYWGGRYLNYTVDFGENNENVMLVLSTKNTSGSGLPNSYTYFDIDLYIDEIYEGRFKIPANTDDYRDGLIDLGLLEGEHIICIEWLNDYWAPKPDGSGPDYYDANIQINKIQFNVEKTSNNDTATTYEFDNTWKLRKVTNEDGTFEHLYDGNQYIGTVFIDKDEVRHIYDRTKIFFPLIAGRIQYPQSRRLSPYLEYDGRFHYRHYSCPHRHLPPETKVNFTLLLP